ncbi:hypothetical protein BCF33_0161 [Hasllibacter halocynthiae]|uniref:Carbon monoxide dehydrogenase subunit G n=1 Tax=Hasllibacter halocynthiae TaxID=595589 RepID=A0A2T0X6K8_9RHOB|nr:carbon monoxide dehydrogenase subunit G [Hasllibacter halocynthiae]PRY94569.1 hypothetical protein BCF33_0161 [Hasllibacter halocynthiae]
MEFTGSRTIAAPRAAVWAALTDPSVLRQAIPGCTQMTGSVEEGFDAVVTQKVGPVKATFRGTVTLSDVVPGASYRIEGAGKGGVAGFARGGADVRLTDADGGVTLMEYAADGKVGGKLAQLGGRVVGGFARTMADRFFANLEELIEDARPPEGPR